MSLLLDSAGLDARAALVGGSDAPLAPLAVSLGAELDRAIAARPQLPAGKARLTRGGGRCATDGTLLTFDPYQPTEHRCPRCGSVERGETHHQWWIMGYQLWLAERAVQAAALHAVTGAERFARYARDVLAAYTAAYLTYPNRDNVLGPGRPFFSTYLESLWLLHLCLTLDLLEARGAAADVGAEMRDRLIEPSRALIAAFNEGDSNRQVWHAAALAAAAGVLGDDAGFATAIEGRHGIVHHLGHGLLGDGTWYEGENYHQFVQRGLWYGVTMLERRGGVVPAALADRWRRSAAAPFLTALPDLTAPARRDSQHAVSLRQWRFAELAELGLARDPGDPVLAGALATLYAPGAERRDTGRWRSTGEAERNEPASALDRADLGWRSLLCALADPRLGKQFAPRSVLMAQQGLAVVRRSAGELYAALDYGHTGGGHGHPDRLGIMLVHGTRRWLDDPGTGSYTEPQLHWYRSTLAHQAPLIGGLPQAPVAGHLLAWEDRGAATWADAAVNDIAPGAVVRRTLVVMPDYLVDEVTWSTPEPTTFDLPAHVDADVIGIERWEPGAPPAAGTASASIDGDSFLSEVEHAAARGSAQQLRARIGDERITAWVLASPAPTWWRATGPGAPGSALARFVVARQTGAAGRIATVWSWAGGVDEATLAARTPTRHEFAPPDDTSAPAAADERSALVVQCADGTRHEHWRTAEGWHVELFARHARSSIDLGGLTGHDGRLAANLAAESAPGADRPSELLPRLPDDIWGGAHVPLPTAARAYELGEPHWRGSEQRWDEAGRPTARVRLATVAGRLALEIDVRKSGLAFAPPTDENPLDNEHPDINSDGVQLHVLGAENESSLDRHLVWLLVPDRDAGRVRVTPRTGAATQVDILAWWRETRSGWALRIDVPLAAIVTPDAPRFALDVLVNEMPPDRERRRGQLVLSGARGERVWLRGDRQDPSRFLRFRLDA